MWNIQLEHDVLWKLRALIPAISVAGGQKPPDSGPTCELDFCNATVHCPYKKWWQLTTQNCHGKIWQICCHQFEGIYTQNSYKTYFIESTNSCRLSEWHCIKVALPNQTVQLPTLWGISIVWHVPLGTWRWYAFQRGKSCPGGKPQVNTAILLNVILKHGSWMRNTMQLLCRIGPIFTWPTVYSKHELWWVRPLHQRAVLGN